MTHRAAVLQDCVCELAVSLSLEFAFIGAHQPQGFLHVPAGVVHVRDAVLAVVRDVLGGPAGQQAEEGELHVQDVIGELRVAVAELRGQHSQRSNVSGAMEGLTLVVWLL